jgi:chitodextrinase
LPYFQPIASSARFAIICAALAAAVAMLAGCPAPPEEEGSDAGSGGGSSGGGSSLADSTAPGAPTGLVATSVLPAQINLRWNPASDNVGVTRYRVYRGGALLATLGNVTTYQDGSVAPSTNYSYTVQALDAAGNASGQSPALLLTTPAAPDTTAPTPPTGLSATAISGSRIDLAWTAATDNVAVTGYRVLLNGATLANLGNVTSYQSTGLAPGITYVYTVRALDAAGNLSAVSNAATATTPGVVDSMPPTTPATLSAVAASNSQINLAWAAATDNVAVSGYRIYRDGVLVAVLPSVLTYQDGGLQASTSYSYNVDAVDAVGNASGLSPAASATTLTAPDTSAPSTPLGLSATAVSFSQINLTWLASTDNIAVTGYHIFRNGTQFATVGNVTSYQNTGLSASTTYSYRVRAFDAAGNLSSLSSTRSATTPAAPDTTAPTTPGGLSASASSSSRINLNWSPSTDNVAVTGYRVYRNNVFVVALNSSNTTYQDTGLAAGTNYTYVVDAVDAAGNASGVSNSASATTLAANTASLSWDAVNFPTLSGYRVYYGTSAGNYLQAPGAGINVGNVTNFTVTGLGAGTRYFFAVTAFDSGNNESGYSNEVFKDIP